MYALHLGQIDNYKGQPQIYVMKLFLLFVLECCNEAKIIIKALKEHSSPNNNLKKLFNCLKNSTSSLG